MRLRILTQVGLTALALSAPAWADEPMYYAPGGIAISGYDPVSYFTEGKPVRGAAANALMWRGATWYFSSPDTLMAFEMNPEAFAPQFGGYCAYAVAEGGTSSGAPDAFFIIGGRLYFMHDHAMLSQKQAELGEIVHEAEMHWPAVLRQ